MVFKYLKVEKKCCTQPGIRKLPTNSLLIVHSNIHGSIEVSLKFY